MSNGARITKNTQTRQLPALVPYAPQKVSFSAASAQSAALSQGCTCIRVFPTQDCYIKIGFSADNPIATSSDTFCPGGIIQYFGVESDIRIAGIFKVAVIRDTTDGTFHIMEGL